MLWSIAGEKRDLLAQCQDFFMTDTTSKHSSPKLIKLFFQGGNFSLIFFYQRLLINNLQSINLKWFLPFGSHTKYISAIYKKKLWCPTLLCEAKISTRFALLANFRVLCVSSMLLVAGVIVHISCRNNQGRFVIKKKKWKQVKWNSIKITYDK